MWLEHTKNMTRSHGICPLLVFVLDVIHGCFGSLVFKYFKEIMLHLKRNNLSFQASDKTVYMFTISIVKLWWVYWY